MRFGSRVCGNMIDPKKQQQRHCSTSQRSTSRQCERHECRQHYHPSPLPVHIIQRRTVSQRRGIHRTVLPLVAVIGVVATTLQLQKQGSVVSSVNESRLLFAGAYTTTRNLQMATVDPINNDANIDTTIDTESPASPLRDENDDIEQRHVISWQGLDAMDAFVDSIWKGNLFCDTVLRARHAATDANATTEALLTKPVTLNISFGCEDLFHQSDTGSGNFLLALYMMRSSADYLGNVRIHFACHDATSTAHSLILPWFTGRWNVQSNASTATLALRSTAAATGRQYQTSHILSSTENTTSVITKAVGDAAKEACCPFWCTALGHMHSEMQYDLRRMAISLVGVLPNHPSTDYARQYLWNEAGHVAVDDGATTSSQTTFVPFLAAQSSSTTAETHVPLFPDVDLDDAVIHFRCGDLLSTNISSYGFMTFAGYVRHISPQARSIGILTQPFPHDNIGSGDTPSMAQQRLLDMHEDSVKNQRCKTLVLALKEYIQERHPQATVTIRNNTNETIALAYARMVMANQSIGAMSTFSVFPILATFGTGFFLKPNRGSPNSWLGRNFVKDLASQSHNNIVLFDETKVLVGAQTRTLWDAKGDDAVLAWFRS